MFRIEFFVDDKKLGAALVALMGLAHGQPSVQPVVNAVKNGNGLAAVSSGGAVTRVKDALKTMKKGTELETKQFKELLKTLGINPSGMSYYTKQLSKGGVIKRTGVLQNSRYVVQ